MTSRLEIKQKSPVILNVANMVTPQRVADAINFFGGSPIMFTDSREAEDLTAISSAVVFNLGSTNKERIDNILKSGKVANKNKIPVIVDPVAVGATQLRHENFMLISKQLHFSVIRGNAGEIAHLANVPWHANGIDAGNGSADIAKISKIVAKKYNCFVVTSGQYDIVTDGTETYEVKNGHPFFKTNVGSGDMLDGVIAAALACTNDLQTLAWGTSLFSICGEIAGKKYPNDPASFMLEFFNQLAKIDDKKINENQNIITI